VRRPLASLAVATCLLMWARPGISAPPSLVLVLVVDQFAAHQLERWGPLMTGGLGRLLKKGAVHTQARYAYANTETAPGHATAMTGAWPAVHGIIANRWHEEGSGRETYCYEDATYGRSPARLAAPTFADALRLASAGKSKTVSIALKDRAAIPMGGTHPTLSAWYDSERGRVVSGRWPGAQTPEWFEQEVLAHPIDAIRGKVWDRFRPKLDYVAHAGIDDHPAEADVPGLGRSFPRTLPKDLDPAVLRDIYPATPWGLQDIFRIARRAIAEEKLGRRGVTDLLALGITTTDYSGHWWGAYSQEQLDILLRLDAELGALLKELERSLGRQKLVVVLTGDHGAVISPEKAEDLGVHTQRISKMVLQRAMQDTLRGQAKVIELNAPHVYLSPTDSKVNRSDLRRQVAARLTKVPGISEAWAVDDVQRFAEPYGPMFARSLYAGRRPDILMRVQPGYYVSRVDAQGHGQGTGHGSPYVHDMAVPLLIMGSGVRVGTVRRPVNMTRLAPTLAALVGMPPPAAALEPPLDAVVHN